MNTDFSNQLCMFTFEPDWIDQELIYRPGAYVGSKQRIIQSYKTGGIETMAKLLSNAFGNGGHCGPGTPSVWHDHKGYQITSADRTETVNLSWPEVAKRMVKLIENGFIKEDENDQ